MDLASPPLELSKAHLESTFAALKTAYAGSPAPDRAARTAQLKALECMLRDNMDTFAEAISKDFSHRSPHETKMLECFPALESIKNALKHLRSWMKPQRSWASFWFLPGRTEIRPQPLGVIGIIVPWNYPLFLAITPLVSALAAGNRAMIKMSEFSPHVGELLATLIAKYLPPDQVIVINGGPETGKAFSSLPFDHLLFTGSTQVGRHVMRAAAENLTPVTLELGGKSPTIIGNDFPIAEAAERIMYGKCLNAGQTCIAPDYVLVPLGRENEFVAAARAAVSRHYPTLKDNPDYTAIINERHLQRLSGYLDDAIAKGATVTECNPASEVLSGTRKILPAVVTQVTPDMQIAQEEIFGPILPVFTYKSLNEAIAYVNGQPRPLALYYFGYDQADIDRVLDETISGGVSINETIMHIAQEHLPFGGVGPSGMGHYHGRFGFETFSKSKPIFHQSRLNGLKLLHPPYSKRFDRLIKLLLH